MFNINDFRGKLVGGGARANLFQVIINSPTGANVALNTEQMSFMCKAASLPGSQVGVIEVPYFGRTIKVAGDRSFQDWTVTVINDEPFDLRNALERWQSAMSSFDTKGGKKTGLGATANPATYSANGQVIQYGKEGNIIKTVNLINIFPSMVGEIALSWDQAQQIEEFQVTFSYDYFTSDSAI